MRNATSLVRVVLALAVALLVAGPALLMAAPPFPDYAKPTTLLVLGPATAVVGSNYNARITFDDGSTVTVDGPESGLTFSVTSGSIDPGSGVITATGSGRARVDATFTYNGASVTGSKNIRY